MPVFAYEGRTASGDTRRGQVEAQSLEAARSRLRQMSIQPTSLKKSGGGIGSIEINIPTPEFLKPKVTTKDLVIFVRQFATMIDSGLPLVQCLDIQAKQAPNPTFRDQLSVIKEQVESGSTFADALKKFPKTFDALFRNMIAAGEVGGILDTILNRLAQFMEKNEKLKREIRGAMTYPAIVVTAGLVIVTGLLLFVVPTFEEMFAEMGQTLPAPTQLLIDMSKFVTANWMFLLLGIVGTIGGFIAFYRNPRGEVLIDGVLLKAPVFGDLLTKVAVARFCRTLGTMIASGVPILEALDICSRTAGNKVIENAVGTVREAISEGRSIAEPLSETKLFPEMVCQMVAVGEATGALDVMLNKIADFYEEEVDAAVDAMTSMLEPIIIIGLGIGGGFVVIALYMPIFSMSTGIGG